MRGNTGLIKTNRRQTLGMRTATVATLLSALFLGVVSPSFGTLLSSCSNSTLRAGPSAALPDCRAYEQVSPVDKTGFSAYPAAVPPVQLSTSGETLAYLNRQAFPGAVGNTAAFAAHVSTRTAHGWQTEEWTPRIPNAEVLKAYKLSYVFSSDLSQAILQVPLVQLTPEATPYVTNLFRRDPEGAYSLINAATPKLSAETLCGPALLAICWSLRDASAFAGASRDFQHIVFESNAQFTENAPTTGIESLYENSNGTVHLAGILPDGIPAASSTAGAGSSALFQTGEQEGDRSLERAVSEDGSHVVFQAPADGGEPVPGQSGLTEVYDRINGSETIEISIPDPEAAPSVSTAEPATFQTASSDGSRVFFTSTAELTTQSNTGTENNSADLYEYTLTTKHLTDLTVDMNAADALTGAMVQGVVDISADGAYVYFVANGQLVEGKGVDGQPNLYMMHNGGSPVFIATLNTGGSCHFLADSCDWSPFPALREAYVTPDGRHMAFMSSRSISTVNFPNGYNNIDQENGTADTEVYVYSAPTRPAGTGQLVCASCDPTGTQPIGNALIGGISRNAGFQEGKPTYSGISTPFYRVRALSENGSRLFYTAPASLETSYNDVFEYEVAGEGSCTNPSGCQFPISDSSNSSSDYFLGSSAEGRDVFIATSNRLVLPDADNLTDVYDARVDGGITLSFGAPLCESSCHQRDVASSSKPPESGVTGASGNVSSRLLVKKCKRHYRLRHTKCVKNTRHKTTRLKKQPKPTHVHQRAHQ